MAVHAPEVCYRGAGYELGGPPENLSVPSAKEKTWDILDDFARETGTAAADLRLTWSWNAGNGGKRPQIRAGNLAVSRFFINYIFHRTLQEGRGVLVGSRLTARLLRRYAQDFMRQFLPKLHQALFELKTKE